MSFFFAFIIWTSSDGIHAFAFIGNKHMLFEEGYDVSKWSSRSLHSGGCLLCSVFIHQATKTKSTTLRFRVPFFLVCCCFLQQQCCAHYFTPFVGAVFVCSKNGPGCSFVPNTHTHTQAVRMKHLEPWTGGYRVTMTMVAKLLSSCVV